MTKKQRYGAIDGLRAFSAIGIVLMHVLSNGKYAASGFVFERLIPSFTDLVFLFMVVSGFSVCCGYYDKIVNNEISMGEFYAKRYAKVWPFFAVLCIVDLVLSPSINSLYEVFANLTLCFGLLPNARISVIGVGWFLGVVFVFYMVFPFVCWLLSNKIRAWLSFGAALVLNLLCSVYFDAGRTSFIYCAVFFLVGGLIFLYKEQIGAFVHRWRWLVLLGGAAVAVGYYILGGCVPVVLVLVSLMLIYTLDGQGKYCILENRVTKFLSSISLEIYLCHMVVFRIVEKARLTHLFASDILSFAFTAVVILVGAVVLSVLIGKLLKRTGLWIQRKKVRFRR